MRVILIVASALSLFIATDIFAQNGNNPPYKDSTLPVEQRVKDLLGRMTKEEKFCQMFMIPEESVIKGISKYYDGIFGFQLGAVPIGNGDAAQMLQYDHSENIDTLISRINKIQRYFVEESRLGIPVIFFDEALHGLVRGGCSVFPQAIGLAATWNLSVMERVAGVIAQETKARGIRQVLSPVINIATDVRWGRTEETYGEDPFLTSSMGLAFVKAFESNGIITTPKHFIANVGDGGRDSYPIHMDERYLEEIHLSPFRAVIQKGGARSVMTSYNSLNGEPCSSNSWLLRRKLKGDIAFSGFVISDAGATGGANVLHNTSVNYPESGKQAIKGGLDVIFQTAFDHKKLFIPPFLDDSMTKEIDESVARILRAKFELGLFEDPYVSKEILSDSINAAYAKKIARESARESFVLLKNDNRVLPVDKSVKKIAVIGVDAVERRMGGYSGTGNGIVSILDGIRARAGKEISVKYHPGCGRDHEKWVVIPDSLFYFIDETGKLKNGLKGEYFSNLKSEGIPVITRVDKNISFRWTLFSPDTLLKSDNYSVRWSGKLKSPLSGCVNIGLDGNDGFRLYFNGKLVIDNWNKVSYTTKLIPVSLIKNQLYDFKVEFKEPSGNASINMIWDAGVRNDCEIKIVEAVKIAGNSDLIIVVAGIEEGEFRDRALLTLPGLQEKMITELAATGKPVVVLLSAGSAVVMADWLDKISSVMTLWYPGEEGGNAVADLLFGDYNPSGRLPVTFPVSEAQLPLVYNHKPTGRGDDYLNLSGKPLFPFGFGLSYTTFDYSDLRFEKNKIDKGESVKVFFKLKNSGAREGAEVVQLYIRDMLSTVSRPLLELKGFQKINLKPGEERELMFKITPEMLEMFDKEMKRVIDPGDFRIMIGSSSAELYLKGNLTVR